MTRKCLSFENCRTFFRAPKFLVRRNATKRCSENAFLHFLDPSLAVIFYGTHKYVVTLYDAPWRSFTMRRLYVCCDATAERNLISGPVICLPDTNGPELNPGLLRSLRTLKLALCVRCFQCGRGFERCGARLRYSIGRRLFASKFKIPWVRMTSFVKFQNSHFSLTLLSISFT